MRRALGLVFLAGSLVPAACDGPSPDTARVEVERRERRAPAAPAVPAAETVATPLAPAFPRPHRILLVGDSVAVNMTPPLEEAAAAAGIGFRAVTQSGCGIAGGLAADASGRPFPFAQACNDAMPAAQVAALAEYQPDLVVWLSAWERLDRIVDGRLARLGTFEGNRLILAEIDVAATRLAAGGARLVFIAFAPSASEPQVPGDPAVTPTLLRLNALLREYARQHADRVTVVDLGEIVCPAGPPCPAEIGGVRPRPIDGNHFDGPGAAWVGLQLFARLLGAAPVTDPPAATAYAGVAPG